MIIWLPFARIPAVLYRFGTFEVDDERFELRREGHSLAVQRRVLDAIVFLIARRDRLVTKADFMAGPWSGSSVTDSALHRVMMVARKTLAGGQDEASPIQTVRGKGYRFVAEVETTGSPPSPNLTPVPSATDTPVERLFVGRRGELTRLIHAFELACAKQGGLVLLSGEPGMGKTCLAEQFATAVRLRGGEVWTGRAWDSGGAPALWPWLEAIRCGLELRDSQGIRELLSYGGAGLVRLCPDFAQYPTGDTDTASGFGGVQDTPQSRFRAFDAVSRLVRRAAELRPIVLLFDDLHAADDASVLLLDFLGGSLADSRILVLGTYRPLQAQESPAVASFIAGPHPHVDEIALAGLSVDEVATFLRGRFGWEVSEHRAKLVHRATGGNPFLIQELARTTPAGGDASLELASTMPLPDRAARTIREHLHRLSPGARALLEVASVFGREFSLVPLCEVGGLTESGAMAWLDRASSESLAEPCPRQTGVWQFAHQLIRETLYRDLPGVRRSELHFLVATCLARRPALDDEAVFQIAHHYFLSAPYQGVDDALHYTLEAGLRARRAVAYELAAEHYERAVQLLELAARDPPRLCDTLLLYAEARALAGELSSAITAFQRVVVLARASGLDVYLARAALGWFRALQTGSLREPELQSYFEEVIDAVHEQPLLRVQVLVALACQSYFTKPMGERQHLIQEALEIVRAARDPIMWAAAFSSIEVLEFFATAPETGLALASEMLTAAAESGEETGLLHARVWRALHLLQLGRVELFRMEAAEHARLAKRIRHPAHLYYAELGLGCTALISGELDRAERRARRAAELGESAVGLVACCFLTLQLMTLGIERGWPSGQRELLEAESRAKWILDQVPLYVVWRVGLARMALERGDRNAARRQAAIFYEDPSNEWAQDGNYLPMLAHLAVIAAATEDRSNARALYARLLPHSGQHVVVGFIANYWGPVSYYLGILARAFGEAGDAKKHLEQARTEAADVGAICYAAWADYALARVLAEATSKGACNRCAELLGTAQRVSTKLGMSKLADKSGALAARLGLG